MRVQRTPTRVFDAIIFDFDGTLIASFPAIVHAWNAAFQPILGREVGTDEVIAHFGVPDTEMILGALPPDLSALEKNNALERYFAAYEAAHSTMEVFTGIPDLLRALQKAGIPLGLMTGKGRRATDITLAYLDWRFFSSAVTGDEIEFQKPHPQGLLQVARELGVDPAGCAFIGDSPADISAAQNAGMFSIVAGWHAYYHKQLQEMKPDFWPQSPLELHTFFLSDEG